MNSLLTTILVLLSSCAFGQLTYYKMPNGRIIDAETYIKVKENLSRNGKVEEVIIKKTISQDSVIITPRITVLTQKDKDGNYVDPYRAAKKLIGHRFPIEQFKNDKGVHFAKGLLEGKPSLISLWFTTCVPCVAEIPILNSIRTSGKNQFNFFAITFERKSVVDSFLKKVEFDFFQVTDAKLQLELLKISAYPANFILNKNGRVVDVYGEISNAQKQLSGALNDLL